MNREKNIIRNTQKLKKILKRIKKQLEILMLHSKRLSTLFKDLHFKQKAIEDIVPEVDKYYKDLNKINSDLEKLKKSRSKDSKKNFTVKEI